MHSICARALGPTLQPGNVVVVDHVPAHKVAGLAELVDAHGAHLCYLQPYSPDFNPLEPACSQLKSWLRTAQTRTREALEAVIDAANWLIGQDIKKWIDSYGLATMHTNPKSAPGSPSAVVEYTLDVVARGARYYSGLSSKRAHYIFGTSKKSVYKAGKETDDIRMPAVSGAIYKPDYYAPREQVRPGS